MKIKTSWELEKLFYKSLKDPRIVRDIAKGDKAIAGFVAKYSKNKKHLNNPKALKKALEDYEALDLACSPAPLYYANYRKELNAKDTEAEAFLNKCGDHYTKRGTKLIFFTLELGKISATAQKKMLASKELAEFRYWLERLFLTAKHDLSEPEEKILSLMSDVSGGRWIQAVDNILNTRTVIFKNKKIPLNEASEKVSSLPKTDRRALHKIVMNEFKNVSQMAESELNALVSRKKITDELRGFKEPYDATILGYENDRESVLNLVKTVTKQFPVSQRFYKLKAKMLKEKTLTYAERGIPVGKVDKKVSFVQAAKIVHDAFNDLHPRYAVIFDRLLSNGQVDVYPKAGKTSGAYCSFTVGQPTLVLLNHIDNARSLMTLAHEMGHAIHGEQSKRQRPLYEMCTIATAEVASTFFEQVAFNALLKNLSGKERMLVLHNRLQDDVSTVFRQIACFNFEVDMHKAIRQKGLLSKEDLAVLLNSHMAAYLGPVVKLAPEDGYFFVMWGHIRRSFYVYSYVFGLLVARALYERVKKDPSFIETIDKYFLQAGGSASPEDIFAQCGLDLYKPDVFLEGLKGIEKDIKELEKAVGK